MLLVAIGATSACSGASTSTDKGDSDTAVTATPDAPETEDTSRPDLPDGFYLFGETTPALSTSRHRPPVTFTVSPPEEFTPVEPAEKPLAVNMYFTVSVTNLSDDEAWSPTILTEACSDNEIASLIPCESPGEIIYTAGRWTDYPDELPPGESMSFRVEYSLASSEYITLDLDIDGLAGPTIHFVTDAVSVDD